MPVQSPPTDLSSARPTQTSPLDTGNDSEWEYEYDDNETEEIYFTLDLTTHVPNAIQEKTYAKNGKLIHPDKTIAGTTSENPSAPTIEANGQDAAGGDDDDQEANAPDEGGKLQILDLHTEKPYVKFNNGFYTCHWFTDLGTQFWITNPGVVSDPKLSGHVLDVVGSSQTRLVARPANLKRRRDTSHPELANPETTAQSVEVDDNAASDISDTEDQLLFEPHQNPTEPMIIPRQKIKDPHLAAQADFMERLSAVKLKKGEKDAHKIPMRIPVYYKGAHNADELRAAHETTNTPRGGNPTIPPETPAAAGAGAAATPTEELSQPNTTEPLDPNAPIIIPKYTRRPRGGPRGGVPSNAARRSNLGLELTGETPPPRKRGRVSNAEKARRAAVAQAQAEAQAQSFALDPQLGGTGTSTPRIEENPSTHTSNTDPEVEIPTPRIPIPISDPTDPLSTTSAAVLLTQDPPPRKRRRTKAQMEEARRLDYERRMAEASQAGDDVPSGRRSTRTSGRRSGAREDVEGSVRDGDGGGEEESPEM